MFAAFDDAAPRATPALPALPNGLRQQATPSNPGASAGPEGADRTGALTEMKARLEQDLNYQILKRTFRTGADDKTLSTGPKQDSSGSDPVREPRPVPASPAGLELDISFQRTTFVSLEIAGHATSGEFRVRFEAFRHESVSVNLSMMGQPQQADPLVLDLGGEGLTTTGVERGVAFDITGDGRKEQVSFVSGNSWFLALDRNGNGVIDDGRELFGDQNGAANGFEELSRFDGNGDGVIDAGDAVFDRLRLFRMDADGTQHLKSLESAGVSAIHLSYTNTAKPLNDYDVVAQVGRFERTLGGTGEAADILLGYRALA